MNSFTSDAHNLSPPKMEENLENRAGQIAVKQAEAAKSILKTKKTFIAREKTILKREKTDFNQVVEYSFDGSEAKKNICTTVWFILKE